MLVGVAADKAAVPPERAKAKSDASKAPLPPLVLYTASDIVTARVPLSDASETPAMVAAILSFKVAVLLLWVVDATFPFELGIAHARGVITVEPLVCGGALRLKPNVSTLPEAEMLVGVIGDILTDEKVVSLRFLSKLLVGILKGNEILDLPKVLK